MADAYATLANGGIHHDPTAISKVEFPNGKVDESGADDGERVLTEGQAYEVTRVLEGVITRAPAPATPRSAAAPRPARPAPPRKSPTPGSSATRRCSRPRSGSATRSRANTPASAAPPPARSGSPTCRSRPGRQMPRIRSPRQPARTLRPRQRPHLRLSGYSAAATKKKNTKRIRRSEAEEGGRRPTEKKAAAHRQATEGRSAREQTGRRRAPDARLPNPGSDPRPRLARRAIGDRPIRARRLSRRRAYSPISSIR